MLEIRRIGYVPKHYLVSVRRREVGIPISELRLEPSPVQLQAVGVRANALAGGRALAEFYERRERDIGSYITRGEFEEMGNPQRPTDVLQRMSGVRVLPRIDMEGRLIVTMQRGGPRNFRETPGRPPGCPPLYFLDRLHIGSAEDIDIDAFLPLADIEAVEAHSSVASLPPYFNRAGAACGVIAFWTRHAAPSPTGFITPRDYGGGLWNSTYLHLGLALVAVLAIAIVTIPSIHF
jgi:hypothetical protein